MNPTLFLILAGLAGVAGFGAGLLGVGGGILLFPLLLYLPPLLGLPPLDAKTVAALVISQVFFSGVIGGFAHWRRGRVHAPLTLVSGATSAVGSFVGGVASKFVSEWFLIVLFGIVTVLAGALMFLPGLPPEREKLTAEQTVVPMIPLAILSAATGGVVGFLGAGNFILVPLLIYVLRIPTRITIGSSLVVHVLNTSTGFLGKLLTGQVPLGMTFAVIIGAGLGAFGGERSHNQLSPQVIRYLYGGVVTVVALGVWISLLRG